MTKSIDGTFLLDTDQVESYLKLLDEQWVRFNAAQDEVDVACGADNVGVEESTRTQAETWYAMALANFSRAQKCHTETSTPNVTQPTNVSTTMSASVRLPKMELPTFSGDSTEWVGFTIHSAPLLTLTPRCRTDRKCTIYGVA